MKSRHISILLAVPLLLSTASCGGSSEDDGIASAGGSKSAAPSASGSQTVDADTAQLRWARCLREHGVNMPDDMKNLPRGGLEITDKAEQACKRYRPQGDRTIDTRDPETRDRLARFAKCMREHGFEMTETSPPDIHLKNPQKWESASKSCNHILQGRGQ